MYIYVCGGGMSMCNIVLCVHVCCDMRVSVQFGLLL